MGFFFLKKKRHKNVKVAHKNHYIFTQSSTKRWVSWLKSHKTQGKSPARYSFVVNLCLWVEMPGQGSTGLVLWHPGAVWAFISLQGPRAAAACGSWQCPRVPEPCRVSIHPWMSLLPCIPVPVVCNPGCKGSHRAWACSMAHVVPWLLLAPQPLRWGQHKHYSTLCKHLFFFLHLKV